LFASVDSVVYLLFGKVVNCDLASAEDSAAGALSLKAKRHENQLQHDDDSTHLHFTCHLWASVSAVILEPDW
jgi:hypothetical protein